MDKQGKAPIHVRLSGRGARREMSLGIKVFANERNQEAGIIMGSGSEVTRMNKLITRTKAKLEQIELPLSAQSDLVTPDMVKKAFQPGPVEKVEEELLGTLFEVSEEKIFDLAWTQIQNDRKKKMKGLKPGKAKHE